MAVTFSPRTPSSNCSADHEPYIRAVCRSIEARDTRVVAAGVTRFTRRVRRARLMLRPETMRSVCYRPRYLNIQRLNYLWTIRHSSARIAGNLIT